MAWNIELTNCYSVIYNNIHKIKCYKQNIVFPNGKKISDNFKELRKQYICKNS